MPETVNVSGVALDEVQVQWLENEYGVEERYRPILNTPEIRDSILAAVHGALEETGES